MKLVLQIALPDCELEIRKFENINPLIIGRSEGCGLSLPMLSDISRRHAQLEWTQGQWVISDLDSTFGTFVNGAKIVQPTFVSANDVIRIGDNAELKIQAKASQQPMAPPVKQVGVSAAPTSSSTDSTTGFTPAAVANDYGAWPWHIGLGALTAVTSLIILIGYMFYTHDNPKRGYTLLGMTTGIVGSILLGFVGFYAARKRALQEKLPWRLLTWLRWHLWLSVIGGWMILVHAGFHLDGGSGTWTVLLLLATIGTGVVGWYQYKKVPGQVVSSVGNLATESVQKQISDIQVQISNQLAGRDPERELVIQNAINQVDSGEKQINEIPWDAIFENPNNHAYIDNVKKLASEKFGLHSQLDQQQSLHKTMRRWLWLHIPAAILFGVFFAWHVFDATEVDLPLVQAGPHEFADPNSCAQCHQAQYDDWIGSVHAMAMSSPVTELQNYLVVKKDRFDKGRHGVPVGQLCIECHAPTSVKGNFWEQEDLLATIEERSPSSQFGVSCVACHQVGNIAKKDPFLSDFGTERESKQVKMDRAIEAGKGDILVDYKNFENLEYIDGGRMMFGTVENDHMADGSIVGNSAHKGQFMQHMSSTSDSHGSSFCASCHTVMVDPEGLGADGKTNIVTLQNTYHEWKEGSGDSQVTASGSSKLPVNWFEQGVSCIDCHGKPLEGLVATAEKMQQRRLPLKERVEMFAGLGYRGSGEEDFVTVKQNASRKLTGKYARFAADSDQKFDHPLKHEPTHLHTFVGVDYHLEPDMPYPKGHPRNRENQGIQAQTIENIDQLMKIAAAIKIESVNSRSVDVDIANLATGHHLPAGFAFAREMWIEIAVKKGGQFRVVAGGSPNRPGEPLRNTEKLDKYGEGAAGKLKNFQAVLWNGDEGRIDSDGRHGETVLQNECKVVLKGAKAREHGFHDRELFLKPGEIRTLNIKVDRSDLSGASAVRARLRFRNYPPEFLEQLADRFRHKTDRYQPAPPRITRTLHTPENFVSETGVAKNGEGFGTDPEMWDRDDARADRTEKLIQRLRIFEMAEDTEEGAW